MNAREIKALLKQVQMLFARLDLLDGSPSALPPVGRVLAALPSGLRREVEEELAKAG